MLWQEARVIRYFKQNKKKLFIKYTEIHSPIQTAVASHLIFIFFQKRKKIKFKNGFEVCNWYFMLSELDVENSLGLTFLPRDQTSLSCR